MNGDSLRRIADALERMAPPSRPEADPCNGATFLWDGTQLASAAADPLPADRYAGVEAQMAAMRRNLGALAAGRPAHDMLLWGARGMGKSALVRTMAAEAGVPVIAAAADRLATLPDLFDRLADVDRAFLLFIDDLAFAGTEGPLRLLRSLLDGGLAARPARVRLAVTSNHRHLIDRPADPGDARHARDAADDLLALTDRFGLVLGFHAPDQTDYLDMVRRHCTAAGVGFDPAEAIAFALARGGRSGRTAWHFRTELLSRVESENDSQ